MCSRFNRTGLLAALAVGFLTTSGRASAADPAPTTEKTDWSKFVAVSTITAEVRAVDGDSITLRVYWMAPGAANGQGNKGNTGRRPSLYHSSRGGRGQSNPLQMMMRMARSHQTPMHQEHHDYDVGYFPDTKVGGVKGSEGSPATPASLTAGMVVSALIIHDKAIAAKDMKDTDLKVKAITALGQNPNYKADAANPPKKK